MGRAGRGVTVDGVAGNAIRVLAGLDPTFGQGEFITLVGPAGCGTPSCLDIVCRLTSGRPRSTVA